MALIDMKAVVVNKYYKEPTKVAEESIRYALNLYINDNFAKIFNTRDRTQIFVEAEVDCDLELLNVENILKILDHFGEDEFVLYFYSIKTNSFAFYWRLKHAKRVLALECEAKKDLSDFIKEFLIGEVQKGSKGALPELKYDAQSLIISIDLYLLGDERGYNLLFMAAESGNIKAVNALLEQGMNVSYLNEGKIPADIAYEMKNFEVLLSLLKANSRFPRKFEAKELSDDFKIFLNHSTELRKAVLDDDRNAIEKILDANKNLRYFYDTNNESIISFSIINKKLLMYRTLLGYNLSFGPREDFDTLMDMLNEKEQKILRKFHRKRSRKVTDKHLMVLMSNSSIVHDNFDTRGKLNHVYEAYEYLNNIPSANVILRAVAAKRDFEIHFDFNRDSVRYLDPSVQSYTNGLFYTCGRILIAAKNLLDPETQHEVYGVLIHELTHFCMCLVFNNEGKGYYKKNQEVAEKFENVSKYCQSKRECEPIIQSVYEDYTTEMHHLELIVRSPHLLVQYSDDEERLGQIKEDFKPLHEFFESHTIPEIEVAIPKIENEAKEAYAKALKKISTLKKVIWGLLAFLVFISTFLIIFLHKPEYKWESMNFDDQTKVLESVVNYRGLDIRLDMLMANGSEGFENLSSESIRDALDEDLSSLNKALNSALDPYIFLSPYNLTDEFWNKTLNGNVNFQGHNIPLGEIVASNSSLSELSSDQIKNLLSNVTIEIGSEIKPVAFYIPRKFKTPSDEKLNALDVIEKVEGSRIFVLSDKPGSGKSVVLNHFREKFKDMYPHYWIEFVELKDFGDVFQLINGNHSEIIAEKILKLTKLERDIFIDRFENGKVILLWDAVDEISPLYDGTFIEKASEIFQNTENIQFISTRPHLADKLEGTFNTTRRSLVEYTRDDRNNFIKGSLNTFESLNATFKEKVYQSVEKFIDGILDTEKNSTTSLRDDINNPLMLKMLVEIAVDDKLSEDLSNVYKVFDTFVNLRLEQIFEKGKLRSGEAIKAARDINVDLIHMIHALTYILGNTFDNYLNKTNIDVKSLWLVNDDTKLSDDQLSAYGLLSKSGDKIDFVHRTFAEFFVAKYLIKYIYQNSKFIPTEEMTKQIALLHNIAYNIHVRKFIQELILNFLKTENATTKAFGKNVIDVLEHNFGNIQDYFTIYETAPMFIKFFEKDERVMKILARVNEYKNIDEWMEVELGISLGNKTSYVENDQAGLILMRTWQFEKNRNKVFADFIRRSVKIFDEIDTEKAQNVTSLINGHENRNLTALNIQLSNFTKSSEFLNFSSQFLTNEEMKQIFINSIFIIDENLSDKNESEYFTNQLEMTLNAQEIKTALLKSNAHDETLFYKTLKIENEPLNTKILNFVEKTLSDTEIFELFTKVDKTFESSLPMIAAQYQEREFFPKFINFIHNHTTPKQFRSILLQRDAENDTMLQYAHFFEFADNFVFISGIYNETLTKEEIRKTFTDRIKTRLPSFSDSFKSSNDDVLINVARLVDWAFIGDDPGLKELLSRRNENGDSIFSLYKDNPKFEKKLQPYHLLLGIIGMKKDEIEELYKQKKIS